MEDWKNSSFFKLFLLLIFCMLFLAGCATKENIVIKTEYEYVTYELPKEITTSCRPEKPMSNEAYSKLSSEDRESYLGTYVVSLLGELKKCDNKIRNIEEFISRNNKINGERNNGGEREAR